MRPSLQRRFVSAVVVALVFGGFSSAYILQKFREYEKNMMRVLSGDQKTLATGRVIAARVKVAEELANSPVARDDGEDAFNEKIVAMLDDVKALKKENSDKSLDEAEKLLEGLSQNKSRTAEDLFVHYRNLKTTTFNLYRLSWANKWMQVARIVGIAVSDIDNLSFQMGERAAAGVISKVSQLTAVVTRSTLPHHTKIMIFGQLEVLKQRASRYIEACQQFQTEKATRLEVLRRLSAALKRYNDQQSKTFVDFANDAHADVFKAIVMFLLFVSLSTLWFIFSTGRFSKHLSQLSAHVVEQLTHWITVGGNVSAHEFKVPERPDAELVEVYRALDQTMRRVNSLRKEDLLVKRLLNVPFLLVNRNKQGIFWNSALSILGKVRALEETGPVAYGNLVRFTDVQNKVVDPIGKAFSENKEISQLALLRVGDDGVAVHALCTPVHGADGQVEYVMVHIRDLRDENRRAETELAKQLESVRTAIQRIQTGLLPTDPAPGTRAPVVECIRLLKGFALELQESAATVAGQIQTMAERMGREGQLKKTVFTRTEQVGAEVQALQSEVSGLVEYSTELRARMGKLETRNKTLRQTYEEIRRQGGTVLTDIAKIKQQVSNCVERVEQTEKLLEHVRSTEGSIRALLSKSSVFNANNSILGAKRELTQADVIAVTENVAKIMLQFERSYRMIEQTVAEVDQGVRSLSSELKESLGVCAQVAIEDEAAMNSAYQAGRFIDASTKEYVEFGKELSVLGEASARIKNQMSSIEQKVQRLVQIGQASLELQGKLESGFKGITQLKIAGLELPSHADLRSSDTSTAS
ncbi:MAG: hypothetical protein AB1540_10050 [Bdellovibrionota bacterium]